MSTALNNVAGIVPDKLLQPLNVCWNMPLVLVADDVSMESNRPVGIDVMLVPLNVL